MDTVSTIRRRRWAIGGFSALAGVLATASVAWACTVTPGTGIAPVDDLVATVHEAVHCALPNHPPCPEPNTAPVDFVAHGSGTLYNGVVVDVYQDDDDTTAANDGQFQSKLGGCDGGDPVRGTVTYGRQTVGNARIGTGSGELVATDGPGLYGICAGPPAALSAIGQFIFM